MAAHPHAEYGEQVAEMLASLNIALFQAGGSPYSAEDLKRISVMELILRLASNGVRFTHKPVCLRSTREPED